MTQLLRRTPLPTTHPAQMDTSRPIKQPSPILTLGSTSTLPRMPDPDASTADVHAVEIKVKTVNGCRAQFQA
eukprot:CAMPEP_0202904120 /NCGR_PEP_ID=MMETSP1392-20130828/27968_1 /ASSEMBLY_ACC=CAM_ASM_000868 /TAXON_ID=225041 /ORGANISM="Chlamydomonas chlamydogama, Strain SAG 11-48b" /LENGTH=71 /DNA_ID=CAMNT_0049591607 /DNA_START=270 /DNA_END=483 /DNA_ORIENTATION=+